MHTVDPIRKYEQAKGEVLTVKPACVTALIGANQSIVPAVPGKILRIMGFIVRSASGALGAILFKNGSGGASITNQLYVPASTTPPLHLYLPIVDCGYGETSVGTGIFADVTAADAFVTLWYVEYTP